MSKPKSERRPHRSAVPIEQVLVAHWRWTLWNRGEGPEVPFPYEQPELAKFPPKVVAARMNQLCDRGLTDFGVSLRTAWLTRAGYAALAGHRLLVWPVCPYCGSDRWRHSRPTNDRLSIEVGCAACWDENDDGLEIWYTPSDAEGAHDPPRAVRPWSERGIPQFKEERPMAREGKWEIKQHEEIEGAVVVEFGNGDYRGGPLRIVFSGSDAELFAQDFHRWALAAQKNSMSFGQLVSSQEAALLVLNERARQMSGAKGYDAEHDDRHNEGELALAAAAFAIGSVESHPPEIFHADAEHIWPFDQESYSRGPISYDKPPLRKVIAAAALCVAEIERLIRAGHCPVCFQSGDLGTAKGEKLCERCGRELPR